MSIYQKYAKESFDESGNLVKLELDYPDNFNFGYDVVDEIAKAEPDKLAIVWCNPEGDERYISFSELVRESNRYANVIKAAGLKRGDKVLSVLKRHYEYWFLAVALHKLGITMIPATNMLTADDYIYRFEATEIKGVVCTYQDGVPGNISEALSQIGQKPVLWTVRRDTEGFRNLTSEAECASDVLGERIDTLVTDPMLLYFTSGTTGYPKGVIHDFSYPLAHIVTAKYWQRVEEGGLHFTVAETGWGKASWGKIYGQWLCGCAVMVYDFDNFDPKRLTSVINRYGVTSFCAPPTIYRYLVRKGMPDMPTLKSATTAGEMLSPETFRLFTERTGLPLREGYGQTETVLLTANFDLENNVPGSLGVSSPMFKVELHDKDGNVTPQGEIGEIVVVPPESGRMSGIFSSYLDDQEQFEYVWRGGVYHTGDAAYADENGVMWFHGRFDDIIKTGGYRVGPYEVENIMAKHPAILECSVVGVPDAFRGQAIKAVIVLNAGYEPTEELMKEIKEFTNSRLAEYKWVRIIEFVDEMPKTISGKIRKTVLRNDENVDKPKHGKK